MKELLDDLMAQWDDKLIWLATMTCVGFLLGLGLEKYLHGGTP